MSNFKFDINKFCKNSSTANSQTCSPVNYLKVATGGNDPSISKRKLYSQYVNSSRYRRVIDINPNAPQYEFVGTGAFIQLYPRTQQLQQPYPPSYTDINNLPPPGKFQGKFLY
jgi:hypothetical protein